MKLSAFFKRSLFALFIVLLIFLVSSCDNSEGGDSDGGSDTPVSTNIQITALTTLETEIIITWDDPEKTDLKHIDINCSNSTTDIHIEVEPGVQTCTFNNLSSNTDYIISFISEYTSGDTSESNINYISTSESGTIVYKIITSASELLSRLIETDGFDAAYFLVSDLDLSAYQSNEGWVPIGTYTSMTVSDPFTGIFNGNCRSITGLVINDTDLDYAGFFGYIDSAIICNVILKNCSVTGDSNIGGLIAGSNNSIIKNCSSSGSVKGFQNVGGLAGWTDSSSFKNSHSTSSVFGYTNIGGLIGSNYGSIISCFTECVVSGVDIPWGLLHDYPNTIGGLVGHNFGQINNSYSVCTVTGSSYLGGLTGVNYGEISNCYSNGSVVGTLSNIGGLIGYNGSKVNNCYSTSSVSGDSDVGGLIGRNQYTAEVLGYFFAAGSVEGNTTTGGLIGFSGICVYANAFWNILINSALPDLGYDAISDSNNVDDANVSALSTDEMKNLSNYTSWDFTTIWNIDGTTNNGYPFLRNMP